jgi:hypothetical protein
MEVFDRALPTLLGFTVRLIKTQHKDGRRLNPDAPDVHHALEHFARVILVMKTVSSLCTYLNTQCSTCDTCGFFSPERDSGWNDHALFDDAPLPDAPPLRAFWNAFLRRWVAAIPKMNAKYIHKTTGKMQQDALRLMTTCVLQSMRTHTGASVHAKAMLEHIVALAGAAANSSVQRWDGTSADVHPSKVSDKDVEAVAQTETAVYNAVTLHLTHFAGPVQAMIPEARKTFCRVVADIRTEHGGDIAEMMEAAVRRAGYVGQSEMTPTSCIHGREDSVLDENVYQHVLRILGAHRQFIEYESVM